MDQFDGPPGSYNVKDVRHPMNNWNEIKPNHYTSVLKPIVDSSHRTLTIIIFERSKSNQSPWVRSPEIQVKLSCEITEKLESLLLCSSIFLQSKLLGPRVCRLTYSVKEPRESLDYRKDIKFTEIERLTPCELVFDLIPSSLPLNPKTLETPPPRFKLAVFDMDSTLIDQEVIDELARSIGLTEAVSTITARAMNGEIDFAESLKERVALLRGVRADVWDTLKTDGSITIAEGAKKLISSLNSMGVKTAVVSGGFLPMAEWLKAQLGLDYAFANHLLTASALEEYPFVHLNGLLDSEKPLVDAQHKAEVLLMLAKENGIEVEQTIAVGDGSNDLLMMNAAGLGVAWNAKESVQKKAPARLNGDSLEELLYLFV